MDWTQRGFAARAEWGERGLGALAPGSDSVVIVDVLSFSTAVDVAVSRGAEVLPYRWADASAAAFARDRGARLASRRGEGALSLSPGTLAALTPGERVVLPSPNGATLSILAGGAPTFAACLRNASAVAAAVSRLGPRVAVVPAGERWPDGTLRPAVEDLWGAGAVLAALPGPRSPEAEAAVAAFERVRDRLPEALAACASGVELADAGYPQDVAVAAERDASRAVPRLVDGAYRNVA